MSPASQKPEGPAQSETSEPASRANGGAPSGHVSLEGLHATVDVPHHQAGFWRQWRAFVGPAILVSIGYMDPGNWGTDLAAGAQFKYGLLWVVGLASLMAIVMSIAFFVNAAILVLAAMVFFGKQSVLVPGGQLVRFDAQSDWIRIAYLTLAPLLGAAAASTLFAVALLASGQSSTITGTLAGQVVMEGFLHWRLAPWLRRVITRSLAILPAVFIIGLRGDSSVNDLLTLSQVVLALQLPFAMFPMLHFTSSRTKMGAWKNGGFLMVAGWGSALLITAMDIYGLPDSARAAWHVIVGGP